MSTAETRSVCDPTDCGWPECHCLAPHPETEVCGVRFEVLGPCELPADHGGRHRREDYDWISAAELDALVPKKLA